MSKEGNTGILRHFQLAAVDTTGLASQLPLSLPDAWAFPSWRGTWPLNQHFFASLLPFTFTKASKVSINSFNLGWLCKTDLCPRGFLLSYHCFLRKYKIWSIFHKVLQKIIIFFISELHCVHLELRSSMAYGSHEFIVMSKLI